MCAVTACVHPVGSITREDIENPGSGNPGGSDNPGSGNPGGGNENPSGGENSGGIGVGFEWAS